MGLTDITKIYGMRPSFRGWLRQVLELIQISKIGPVVNLLVSWPLFHSKGCDDGQGGALMIQCYQQIQRWTVPGLFLWILLSIMMPLAAKADQDLWQKLREGSHQALLRHALAPGTGDPAEFTIGDCYTQRNLSTSGRNQAERIGARFRANGVEHAQVFSSQWCRCLDTATLLGLGNVQELPFLNSFFRRVERRGQQTEALNEWLKDAGHDKPLVVVTHQVNITALTGVYPTSGELVIVHVDANGAVSVAGTIETN